MRILIAILFLAAGCKGQTRTEIYQNKGGVYLQKQILDSGSLTTVNYDSVLNANVVKDSIINTLKTKLIISNHKVERVRYYLNICLKNPSQDVFLKGWIKRAIE